jgi:transcriptional regulator with XRE-family HTH domain
MSGYDRSLQDILRGAGERAKQLRLMRGLLQEELAERAGVGIATVRRFEKTGTASIENVLRIAMALSAEGTFDQLFEAPAYSSLDEALARPAALERQRASRKR